MKQLKVNTTELCELFQVSRMTISNYVNAGMPQIERGKFDLNVCWQWRYEQKIKELDKNQYEVRISKAKAEMIEMELAEKDGDLIPIEDVIDEWFNIASNIKTKLLAIPSKLALRLTGVKKTTEIQSILKSSITEVLGELHSKFSGSDNKNKAKKNKGSIRKRSKTSA